MTARTASAKPTLLVAALVLLVASGAGIVLFRDNLWPPDKGPGNGGTHNHPPGFLERARESGITFRMNFLPSEQGARFKPNLYDHGSGVAVGDFDGDGFDDIYFVNQLGKNALYRNKGDGTFEDVTEKAGVALGDRVCVAATWADYDNDGKQDLFVTSTRGGNVLFKNLGGGKFKDVTLQAFGRIDIGHSQTAVFFDYDNDGWLDLLVTNDARWTTEEFNEAGRFFAGLNNLFDVAKSPKEYNILYHNNHDGTFTDVTQKSGLKGLGWSSDAAVFDYNGDGYLDVLVTNMFGRSQLYRNNGNGTFTEVTKDILGRTSWGTTGAKVFDFNNDGKLDLFIVDMHSDMWLPPDQPASRVVETKKFKTVAGANDSGSVFGRERGKPTADAFQVIPGEVILGNTLFKNLGQGQFKEVSDQANMETWWPWGIATGDFDNDGFEDVFIPAGMGYPFFYWHNSLMMNNGDETFTNRAQEEGIEPPARGQFLEEKIGKRDAARSSRAAAVADFDGNGRLNIIVNNFNDHPYYFKNNFPRKNYIAFKLQGTQSNRDAIGALVKLYFGKEVMVRQVNPAGGYLCQSSKTLHFGLGDRTKIDRVEVQWPRPGPSQIIDKFEINKPNKIVEPEK